MLFCLLVREANTWRSIQLLHKYTPEVFHDVFMIDVGTLLRAMFDAYLQAHFITHEPPKSLDRAADYLDFQIVERFVAAERVLRHDNSLTERLKASPLKSTGELQLQREYDRVKDRFFDGKKRRNHWYKGSLPELAKAVDKEAEYDAFVSSFSGCVHSSALAVLQGPNVPKKNALFFASKLAARVAKLNVQHHKLYIGHDQVLVDELSKGWLDL